MARAAQATRVLAQLPGLIKRSSLKLIRLAVLGIVKFSMYCCISLLGFVVLLTLVAFVFTVYSVIRYGRINNHAIDPGLDEPDMDQDTGFQYESLQRNPMFLRRQHLKPFQHRGGVGGVGVGGSAVKPYGDTESLVKSSDFIADYDPFAAVDLSLQAAQQPDEQTLLMKAPSASVVRVSLKVTDEDAGLHLSPEALQSRTELRSLESAARETCQNSHRGISSNPFAKVEYRIIERNLCSGEVAILLFVHSHFAHLSRRQLIRNTYGSLTNVHGTSVRLVFTVGLPSTPDQEELLSRESAIYRDIIVGGFPDRRSNLLLKNYLALHWIVNYCPAMQFAVKLDDDTFLDIVHLTNFLRAIPGAEGSESGDFLYCAVTPNRSPVRRAKSRWYVPYSDWIFNKFPPYCQGFGYVLSRGAVAKTLGCSQSLHAVRLDDVHFTGVVAKYVKLRQMDFWKGHAFVWMEPSNASPPSLNDYIFFASKNTIVQDYLWKRAWKSAVTRMYF